MIPPAVTDNSGTVPVIKIKYRISDRIYKVVVLKDDCNTEIDLIDSHIDEETSEPHFLNLLVSLDVNQETIEGSEIWNNEDKTFRFCLSTTLYSNDDMKISKKQIIFTVGTNNAAAFGLNGVTITIPKPEENNDLNVNYKGTVSAYQCNPDTYEKEDNDVLGPFDILHVCITEDSNPDVIVESIRTLTLRQNSSQVTYEAIIDGNPVSDAMVVTSSNDGVVLASVQLIEAFFSKEGHLNVDGVVLLGAFGDENKRVDDTGKENNTFDFSVELTKPCGEGNGLGQVLVNYLNSLFAF